MNLTELQAEFRRRLSNRKGTAAPAIPPPRYDEVFFEGVAWLDSLAGPAPSQNWRHIFRGSEGGRD